jgi:hypothetical protein
MNLHNVVSRAISAVNPFVTCSIARSAGAMTTTADGTRVASYAAAEAVKCQIQSLQYNDIAQLDGLNIQGIKSKIYINGHYNGLVRAAGKGGDLITMPNGDVWLVVIVLETWPDWCCVGVVMQDGR